MMIDTPQIVQTTDQLTAVIRLTVPHGEMQAVMGPGITELMQVVQAQGVGPAGPWLSHYFHVSPERFDFEIAVPVLAPVTPDGRVQPGRMPAARAARTTYRGAYDGIGAAWAAFKGWVEAHGHTPGTDSWEVYRVGPDAGPDPDDWQTDLYIPLR